MHSRAILPAKVVAPASPWIFWSIGFALIVGLLVGAYLNGAVRWLLVLFGAPYLALCVWHARRDKALSILRRSDSICSFARRLDCRRSDPGVIRVVFEELSEMISYPANPTDSLSRDIGLVDFELDDMVEECARRSRRSLEKLEANPYYGRIKTVSDLVAFLTFQPEEKAGEPGATDNLEYAETDREGFRL